MRAVRYFRLARGYIERQRLRTTLFITCGLTGSGKSTLAAQLSFELGIATYNSDRVRKQMAGLPPDTAMRIPFETGLYSAAASEATYAELLRLAEAELVAGRSVIIDACFISREQRRPFSQLAARLGVPCVVLQCLLPDPEQRRRLVERETAGEGVSDGRPEILELQRNSFQPPDGSEGVVLNVSTAASPDTLTSPIYERLADNDEPTASQAPATAPVPGIMGHLLHCRLYHDEFSLPAYLQQAEHHLRPTRSCFSTFTSAG